MMSNAKRNSSIRNQTNRHHHQLDKGWAWVILMASFMIKAICSGVFISLGVFLVPWQEQLSGSVTKLQWTVSLVIGISMIAGKHCASVYKTNKQTNKTKQKQTNKIIIIIIIIIKTAVPI